MDMMVIIETMVKLLLLMALGFFLNKLGIFSRESNRMLSDLIVKVTTPLLIISSVCETGGVKQAVHPAGTGGCIYPLPGAYSSRRTNRTAALFPKDRAGRNRLYAGLLQQQLYGDPGPGIPLWQLVHLL